MSIRTNTLVALAAALVMAGTSYGQQSGVAEQPATPQSEQSISDRANDTAQRVERSAGFRGTSAREERGRTARLSEIMDLDVHNAQNEDLGDIEDIVIDTEHGKIRYVAVSVGGFLGVGDRLVAVPWQSFKQQRDEDGEAFLVLNIDKARLENAPGFNQENWPDFGNERYSSEIDKYYGTGVDTTTRGSSTTPTTPNRTETRGQQLPQ